MGVTLNIFDGQLQFTGSGGSGGNTIMPYANRAAFPSVTSANNGQFAVALDTGIVYEVIAGSWTIIAGPSDILSVGTIDSNGASANGASDLANQLIMQSASGTAPGLVNLTTQTFAGQKTFSTGLTGTLTGSASLNVLTSALGNLTDAGTDGITVTGGTGATVGAVSLSQQKSDGTHNGYLSSGDWTTFNSKQSATLTNTHILVGNSSNVATDVAASGDLTLANTGAFTFNTVNSNVGSFGSSTSIPSFTVNAKGLITAASGNVVIAPAGTLSGTTLNSTVVSSSLTSVGTIASGTWNGTAINLSTYASGTLQAAQEPAHTGDVTNSAGSLTLSIAATTNATLTTLSALTTATTLSTVGTIGTGTWQGTTVASGFGGTGFSTYTKGDILYCSATNVISKLGIGSTGNLLTVAAGLPSWAAPATSGTVTSVAISVPGSSLFGISGSPVTSSGTLGITTTGTSGGIPYFDSTSTLNSSALLVTNGIVLGKGAGAAPATLATNASTAFPLVSGGTGTAPSWTGLTVAGGGTSLTSGTSGGIPYFSSTSAMTSSALLTQYGVVYGGGAGATPVATAAGTTGQVLIATTSSAPSWGTVASGGVTTATFTAPTISRATVSGTSSGTGGFISGTYTTPTSPRTPLYLKVRMAGGGGGGDASGGSGSFGSASTAGTNTTFGSSLLTAGAGGAATGNAGNGSAGGAGGTNTIAAGPITIINLAGGKGQGGHLDASAAYDSGCMGGYTPMLGGGGMGQFTGAGFAATANTGGGGAGGGNNLTINLGLGGGGGSGGYIEVIITSPAATYAYSVGAGGTGQGAGPSGFPGGAGGTGVIIVEEYYQ